MRLELRGCAAMSLLTALGESKETELNSFTLKYWFVPVSGVGTASKACPTRLRLMAARESSVVSCGWKSRSAMKFVFVMAEVTPDAVATILSTGKRDVTTGNSEILSAENGKVVMEVDIIS